MPMKGILAQDQRSAEWNEELEAFARHKAYKLHKELFKIKDNPEMSTVQTSSEVTSLQKRRIPRADWGYIPRKGCT